MLKVSTCSYCLFCGVHILLVFVSLDDECMCSLVYCDDLRVSVSSITFLLPYTGVRERASTFPPRSEAI